MMKMSIKKFAELTGVSVRTLHYYDEIGLLKPEYVDEWNSYRYYGRKNLETMQEILFFRELDFDLKTIKEIILSPSYDKKSALSEQKQMLILKKERLERMINLIEKGEKEMNFDVFSNTELENYKQEAKQKWGNTNAYKEYEERESNDEKATANGLNAIIAEFAAVMKCGEKADSKKSKSLVEKLKNFITETQYTCTNEILMCLGEMYVGDERFKKNIDKFGFGTAQFMHDAIIAYCK